MYLSEKFLITINVHRLSYKVPVSLVTF